MEWGIVCCPRAYASAPNQKSIFLSMRRCTMLLIRGTFVARASLKRLFSPSRALRTSHTAHPERWKTERKEDHTVSELQYEYKVHAHNESQLPNILVSVTTLLQCSVVYTGKSFFCHFFFSHVTVKGRTTDVSGAQTAAVWSEHLFHLQLDYYLFF